MAGPLRKELFFAASLRQQKCSMYIVLTYNDLKFERKIQNQNRIELKTYLNCFISFDSPSRTLKYTQYIYVCIAASTQIF